MPAYSVSVLLFLLYCTPLAAKVKERSEKLIGLDPENCFLETAAVENPYGKMSSLFLYLIGHHALHLHLRRRRLHTYL